MFHRVDDWRTLTGPRFFRYAVRLPAYAGVMQARVAAEDDAQQGRQAPAPRGPARAPQERSVNDPHLVSKLAAEGWVEHTREGKVEADGSDSD